MFTLIAFLIKHFLLTVFVTATVYKTTLQPAHYFFNLDSVARVTCLQNGRTDEVSVGTGEVIAKDTVITAAHVVYKTSSCTFFETRQAKVVYVDNAADIAVIKTSTRGLPVAITDCGGFIPDLYFGVGFAAGTSFVLQPYSVTSSLANYKTGESADFPFPSMKLRVAKGDAYPGMSGGPVINRVGKVVGIVDAIDHSHVLFRDLKDTPICTPGVREALRLT